MKRFIKYSVCCLLAFVCQVLSAKALYDYTEERPLVIVCDWDFRPFEFITSQGTPAGYNVEVLDKVLNRLEVPHRFVMQEWHVATRMFEHHEADLIHALNFIYRERPYMSTQKYVNFYNLKVARRMDTTPLHRIADLTESDTVMLKRNDYAVVRLKERPNLPFDIGYCSPKDGLTGVRKGQFKYYIWGDVPLSRKVQELGLDSIVLDDIDIPAGELHIIGYDKDLIDLIDDQYTRMEQAGDLLPIYDKWFRPERVHDDASPVALFFVIGLLAFGVVIFLLSRLTAMRVKNAVRHSEELNRMMTQALGMGDYHVIEWNLQSDMLRNKYGSMLPDQGISSQEFLQRMDSSESELLHKQNIALVNGSIDHFDIQVSTNWGTPEEPQWRAYFGNAILEKHNGKPRYVIYTVRDLTREKQEELENSKLASKYMKMFDTNLIAMSFYDADGHLLDVNQKMRELCQINDTIEPFFRSTLLFDFPALKGVYQAGSTDVMHVCQHLNEPSLGLDKYIEFRIMPVINDEGRLIYYIVTSRDITAERAIYLEQQNHDRRLKATHEAVERYERQLHYLLEESKMFMWNFRISEDSIKMTRSPGEVMYTQTLNEYILSINESVREQAVQQVQEALQQGVAYQVVLPFDYTPLDPHPTWYSIAGMPLYDKEGKLVEYFGLARDITDLMHAQEQLRVETERAENSGLLKSAFLANMTHEIRTPLNAIVGFSGLLQMVDTREERMEFIRIIRNNCDMLLRLINDILEASNMGQTISIKPEPVDLSQVFNDICQTLAQRVQEPGVQFLKDNPYDHYPANIDKGRLQQMLTNFVTNAVKYTHEGHIRVGYRPEERDGRAGIYYYCEDTGTGIPKDKQASVFERFVKLNDFVQGTGLGLSICKALVDRSGGQIGVDSEEGRGSTFWFWVPNDIQQASEGES